MSETWWKTMPKKKVSVSTSENVDIQVHITNWNTYYTLLLFYLQLGLVVTRIHRCVEYTPKKRFNSFVQAALDARRKGDENPNSSVVAEITKRLANSSYGYQIMDQSRHILTKKNLTDEKTHAAK